MRHSGEAFKFKRTDVRADEGLGSRSGGGEAEGKGDGKIKGRAGRCI